ncbi:MAG: lysophospholipid acyltransferase family protein [Phycisphaerales bacterium]|jgi:KDO2-lipid IV(A) lauroyltransferase|nr:lysophospholipid acyltransferase family protein [Phycisphaerales bacterium]
MARPREARFTDPLVYLAIRAALGVPLVAGVGPSTRAGDAIGRWFGSLRSNRKRVERARTAIVRAFPDWPSDRVERVSLDAYAHLFRLAAEVAFMPRLLTEDTWPARVDLSLDDPSSSVVGALRELSRGRPVVLITGHCGNWEVLGYTLALLGFPMHALYRPLDVRPLDAWVRRTRGRRGMVLVDKFGALRRLPAVMERGELAAFVADQNAGDRGLFVPFFGRLASTYKSIGLVAMQHRATVLCGCAVRDPARPFQYRVEVVDTFHAEDYMAHPDPLFYLTARYRRAIEAMVRLAPEQYLWMHRMWKSRPKHERAGRAFPGALRDKLASLPWMGAADVDAIVAQSDEDAATLKRLGTDRLP